MACLSGPQGPLTGSVCLGKECYSLARSQRIYLWMIPSSWVQDIYFTQFIHDMCVSMYNGLLMNLIVKVSVVQASPPPTKVHNMVSCNTNGIIGLGRFKLEGAYRELSTAGF